MERIGAMILRSPKSTAPSATMKERAVAMRGSALFFPNPFPMNRGIIRSTARACNVRGAPSREPIALEREAANTPSAMSAGQREMVPIMFLSMSKVFESGTTLCIKMGRII